MHRLRFLTLLFTFLAASIGNASGDELQIVCLGTSFTNGKGVFRSEAWPAKLEADLKTEGLSAHVVNQGVDGDTTRDLKRRLDKAVPEGTSMVILEYAVGNDKRAGIAIEETIKNVDGIVSQLASRKIQVLLVIRAKDAEGLEHRAKQFSKTIAKFGISTINIEQPDSSLLADRQHPTAVAHTQIAASMVAPVKALTPKVRKEQ
jgi:lysophospholipase L1-like esterase